MHNTLWSAPVLHGADAYILPSHDAFRSEMPPEAHGRLGAASGFSGSAGSAVFTREHGGLLLTDGRYTLQAGKEVDTDYFTVVNSGETPLATALAQLLPEGATVAYDASLWSIKDIHTLTVSAPGLSFLSVADNPVDALWQDRPALQLAAPEEHPVIIAGASVAEKLARVAAELHAVSADVLFETRSEAVCWLFNVRGFDMPCTPALFSRAIVYKNGSAIWLLHDAARVPEALADKLQVQGVTIVDEAECAHMLYTTLPVGAVVCADSATVPSCYAEALMHVTVKDMPSCITDMQACKHENELQAITDGHAEDGVAVTRFIFAMERELQANTYKSECELADMLRGFRREAAGYIRDSFETISGIDGNGAIIHYRPHPGKDARVSAASRTLLIDSGGQYPGATTDITRTFALPGVQSEEKHAYTLVMQGHIALAEAVFPEGTTGGELDILARSPLWREGEDYAHGTGHGVGCFMGVHEGPQRIGKRSKTPIHAGMVVSNEPGFYKENAFGIRIENLMAAEPAFIRDGVTYLRFRTLTLAPMDITMLEPALLSPREKAWLFAYHTRIADVIMPRLSEEDAAALQVLVAEYEAL